MLAWDLPTSLELGGVGFAIRSDFRAILDILTVLASPEYEEDEKTIILLEIFYIDYDKIPSDCIQEAVDKAMEFIDVGQPPDKKQKPKLMDWEQDASIIIPEVNKVLGYEVRQPKETHWWTFVGAYMGIGEGLFSTVINVRSKKAKGQKLEKYENEFYRDNKDLVDIKTKLTEEEKEQKEALLRMLNGDKYGR